MSQASGQKTGTPPTQDSPKKASTEKGLEVKWAYALVPDPERIGRFFSVELHNVTYESLRHIEPSQRSESLGSAAERAGTELHMRGRRRAWNT